LGILLPNFFINLNNNIMKTISILFIFCFTFTSSAQPLQDKKRDFAWISGYQTNNHASFPYAGTTLQSFKYCGVQREFVNTLMNFDATSTSICDTSGSLLFYTNGIYIANKNHQKMLNGDSIGFCRLWQHDRLYGGNTTIQGSVVIPKPNSPNIYYLLQASVDYLPTPAVGYWHNGSNLRFDDCMTIKQSS
jgi:hypothetical protein